MQATDMAGNMEMPKIETIKIDKTAPYGSIVVKSGYAYSTSTSMMLTLTAIDNIGVVSYEWDFGDRTTGTGVTTSHVYTDPGNYTVTLTVKDIPLWTLGVVAAVVIGTAIAAILLWRKRK